MNRDKLSRLYTAYGAVLMLNVQITYTRQLLREANAGTEKMERLLDHTSFDLQREMEKLICEEEGKVWK